MTRINWVDVCANYDRRKRRDLVVKAARAVLAIDLSPMSTFEFAGEILASGASGGNPVAMAEAQSTIASDLAKLAYFMPEAVRGEPEQSAGRTIRRWTWQNPAARAKLAARKAPETILDNDGE